MDTGVAWSSIPYALMDAQQIKMGSVLSSLMSPAAADESAGPRVMAFHTKPAWDVHCERLQGVRPAKLMVIEFSASWCGPCRLIEPAFKEMASSSSFSQADFVKIDVDELPEVAKTFGVEAMPTFVLVKGKQEVSRVVGAKKEELERKIQMHISPPKFAA